MKMAKKLLAVVLAGVMAVSMLTGCASISSRQAADELEGMLHSVKGMSKASVTADDDTLAKDAIKDIKGTDGKLISGADAKIKANLDTENNKGKYVWYTTIAAKDAKKADKAAKIFSAMTKQGTNQLELDLTKIANTGVTVGGKTGTDIEPTKGSGKDKTEYTVVIVTCKAVYSES